MDAAIQVLMAKPELPDEKIEIQQRGSSHSRVRRG